MRNISRHKREGRRRTSDKGGLEGCFGVMKGLYLGHCLEFTVKRLVLDYSAFTASEITRIPLDNHTGGKCCDHTCINLKNISTLDIPRPTPTLCFSKFPTPKTKP
jgi:hypothetical protein